MPPERSWTRARLTAIAGVLLPTLLLLSYFPAALLLSPTTASGGDLASHNYAASYARLLLTEHRITGWVPGQLTGFSLFQMYFPAPFLLISALSSLLHPNVAFKLVTVLGLVSLPSAA